MNLSSKMFSSVAFLWPLFLRVYEAMIKMYKCTDNNQRIWDNFLLYAIACIVWGLTRPCGLGIIHHKKMWPYPKFFWLLFGIISVVWLEMKCSIFVCNHWSEMNQTVEIKSMAWTSKCFIHLFPCLAWNYYLPLQSITLENMTHIDIWRQFLANNRNPVAQG